MHGARMTQSVNSSAPVFLKCVQDASMHPFGHNYLKL